MRVICCLVAAVMVIGVRVASAGPNGIVLESYVGARPADADKVVAPLIQEMRRRKYTMGESLGEDYEANISRPSGTALPATFQADADAGIKQWAQGNFTAAVATLQPLVTNAKENPVQIIAKPNLRDAYLKSLIGVGLSQLRLGDPVAAADAFDEIIVSFPNGGVASSTYGPQAAKDFDARKKQKQLDPRGRLKVKAADPDTELFINEQPEGKGFTQKELIPGKYRVIARLGAQFSRVHIVEVRPGAVVTVDIDPEFDNAIVTHSWAGFSFATAGDRKDREAQYAGTFASALGSQAVVVVSIDQVSGSRSLVGAIVQLNGKELRRASVALTGSTSAEGLENLARFLVGENVTKGLTIESDGSAPLTGGGPVVGPGPEHPSTPRSRWIGWPVITTAVALVGIGASAYYLSINGNCKDGTTNPACTPVYETKTGAILGFAGSGVMAALTVYLIVTWPSASSKKSTAFVAPTGDGAIAGFAGRF